MKRLGIGCASIGLAAVLVIAALLAAECRRGVVSGCNASKIKPGMTLGDVEAVFGPGWQELEEKWLPRTPDWRPILTGERFLKWEDRSTSRYFWVAMRGDRVCGTDYWEPSF